MASKNEIDALAQGANVIAREAKRISGRFSRRIPGTIHVEKSFDGTVSVVAGGPAAPNAIMFETLGARHPLFAHGPRGTDGWRHWYTQPYRPFLEEAAQRAAQDACNKFADEIIPDLLDAWK